MNCKMASVKGTLVKQRRIFFIGHLMSRKNNDSLRTFLEVNSGIRSGEGLGVKWNRDFE